MFRESHNTWNYVHKHFTTLHDTCGLIAAIYEHSHKPKNLRNNLHETDKHLYGTGAQTELGYAKTCNTFARKTYDDPHETCESIHKECANLYCHRIEPILHVTCKTPTGPLKQDMCWRGVVKVLGWMELHVEGNSIIEITCGNNTSLSNLVKTQLFGGVCVYIYIYMYTLICSYMYEHACISLYVYVYICIRGGMYVRIWRLL